jgi:heme exporter protein A
VSRRFGPRWVLTHVSLAVPRGSALLLLGPNGSGKTTLLRLLATALRPHAGVARFDGQDLWAERRALREHIALLSHDTRLYEDLTAADNVARWAAMGGYDADVNARLADVGLLEAARRPVRGFSAGMRRRLALALALLKRPRLVLFDEPFTALDPPGRARVHDALTRLKADGATLVVTTHVPGHAARLCDVAARLEGGRVAWQGDAADPEAWRGALDDGSSPWVAEPAP